MGELLERDGLRTSVLSHVVRGRNAGCLHAVGAAKSCIDPVNSAQVLTLKETTMSTMMEDDIKRWTAKRKTALVLDIIQGKTTISEASRAFGPQPIRG